jgi:hypothetical protein
MRMSRSLHVILIHGALTSGCFHYVATQRPAEQSDVRIAFAPPRDVAFERGGTPDTRTHVTELRGRLTAIRGDTLWVTVNELHDTRQPAQYIDKAAVRIVRDSSTSVETWSFNGGRTAGTLAGVSLALLLVYAVIGSSVPGY